MLRAKEREKELALIPHQLTKLQPYGKEGKFTEAFLICFFLIDIERVSVKGLISMRPVLPTQEYRLLKNRKCARESRRKRKQQTLSTIEQLRLCQEENETLKERVHLLEQLLE